MILRRPREDIVDALHHLTRESRHDVQRAQVLPEVDEDHLPRGSPTRQRGSWCTTRSPTALSWRAAPGRRTVLEVSDRSHAAKEPRRVLRRALPTPGALPYWCGNAGNQPPDFEREILQTRQQDLEFGWRDPTVGARRTDRLKEIAHRDTQGARQPHQCSGARVNLPPFNATQVLVIDASSLRNHCLGEIPLKSKPLHPLPERSHDRQPVRSGTTSDSGAHD